MARVPKRSARRWSARWTGTRSCARQARSEGAAQQVVQAAESVASRAVQTYLEVLHTRELARIADENTASYARTLAQVRTLAESGEARRIRTDLDGAKLAIPRIQASIQEARQRIRDNELAGALAGSVQPQQGEPYYVAHVRTKAAAVRHHGKELSVMPA